MHVVSKTRIARWLGMGLVIGSLLACSVAQIAPATRIVEVTRVVPRIVQVPQTVEVTRIVEQPIVVTVVVEAPPVVIKETVVVEVGPTEAASAAPAAQNTATPRPAPPFVDDLLLLLHFDEPAGATLFQDSSPAGHHARCDPAVCPAKAERGLDFDGQGNYIESPASIQGLSGFTLAGWFYARSYEHAGKLPVVFYAPGADCGRAALRIGGGYTEGPVLFVADTDTCVDRVVVSSSGPPPLNQWHHIVAVFDSDTDRHTIYIDGKKVAENEVSMGPIPNTSPSQPMSIGVNFSPRPYDQRWWDGYIDEVALYGRALSASEVETLYQSNR